MRKLVKRLTTDDMNFVLLSYVALATASIVLPKYKTTKIIDISLRFSMVSVYTVQMLLFQILT